MFSWGRVSDSCFAPSVAPIFIRQAQHNPIFLWLDSSFWHRLSPLGPANSFSSLCSFSLRLVMTSSACHLVSSLALGFIHHQWKQYSTPLVLFPKGSYVAVGPCLVDTHPHTHRHTEKRCWNIYWLPGNLIPEPTLLSLMLNFSLNWIYPHLECLNKFGLRGFVHTLGRLVCSLSFLLISRI